MAAQQVIRVLVADDEPGQLEDFRRILRPPAARDLDSGQTTESLFDRLERELFGAALDHKRFPAVDLATAISGREAIAEIRVAVEQGRPFAMAFVDMRLGNAAEGLRVAEHLRTLDPDLFIVLVSAESPIHPVDLSERIPPADQLFFLKKPFHSHEVQQLLLALGARWRAEHRFGAGHRPAAALSSGIAVVTESLEELPAAAVLFDRRDRLLAANEAVVALFPDLADLFVMGTPYEEIMRQMGERLLPDSTLVRIDSWVKDRLDWHNRSGGVLEQKLRGGRWVLMAESRNSRGETYCVFYETTDLRQRDARRATASHMTQMAQSVGALCKRLGDSLEGKSAARNGKRGARASAEVAVLPGGVGRSGAEEPLQALSDKLAAVAQQQKLKPENLDLNRLVGQVVRQARGELGEEVEAEVITGAGLWPVLADGDRLAAALRELIVNASEAMNGSGRLTLETANVRLTREFAAARAGLTPGEYVRIGIQDSGPGMTQDLAERALNPFFTSKGEGGHLGLGLSVVYGFASQSGGYLEIDGGEGQGAGVQLYFPRAEEGRREPRDESDVRGIPLRRSSRSGERA